MSQINFLCYVDDSMNRERIPNRPWLIATIRDIIRCKLRDETMCFSLVKRSLTSVNAPVVRPEKSGIKGLSRR